MDQSAMDVEEESDDDEWNNTVEPPQPLEAKHPHQVVQEFFDNSTTARTDSPNQRNNRSIGAGRDPVGS
jgi:hypothetical protein